MGNSSYAHIDGQKRKYRERYISYYNTYGEDIPYAIRLQLKEYRQSLGLTVADVDDVIEKLKNPTLEVRRIIESHAQDPSIEISVLKDEASILGEQYADLIEELSEFENYVQGVLEMTAQLSDRCKAVTKNLAEFGTTMAQMGFKRMKKQKSGGSAALGIGLAISAAAEIYDQYKKYQIQQQEERRLRTLLEKKQAYANASYDVTHRVLEQSQKTLERCNMLYASQAQNPIAWEDTLRDKKLKMFESAFFCRFKFQYLVELLEFTLQEMEAWLNGEQNSTAPYPSLKRLIDREIGVWAISLTGSEDFYDGEWTKYLQDLISTNKDKYYPIEYMLFMKPYFLRNYIGVALWKTDPKELSLYRATPLITRLAEDAKEMIGLLGNKKQHICDHVKEMVVNNPYFKDCMQLLSSHLKTPANLGFFDVCVLAIMFFVFWLGMAFVLVAFSAAVQKTGDTGDMICFGVLGLLYYFIYRRPEKYVNMMPCIRKNRNYFLSLETNLRNAERDIANKYNDIKL